MNCKICGHDAVHGPDGCRHQFPVTGCPCDGTTPMPWVVPEQTSGPRIRIKDSYAVTKSEWSREFTVEADRIYSQLEIDEVRLQQLALADQMRLDADERRGPSKAEKEMQAEVVMLTQALAEAGVRLELAIATRDGIGR